MALISIVVVMIATIKATGNLFGPRARFFAALLLATSGPVLMLAHLAVYDALAIAGVATCFWCVTELARRDHRGWLVAGALSFSLGVLAKYPTLFFAGPTLMALLVLLRRERAGTDLALFGFVFAVLPMILFLSERGQYSMLFSDNLALQTEAFGASPRTVAYAQAYFTAVPLVLALAGWLAVPSRRLLATVLASGVAGPVAYHLLSQNGVSDHKHAVYGLVFAAPLGGLALAGAARDWPRRVAMVPALAALAFLGVAQMQRLDDGSPDLRASVGYLRAHVKPGQELLINNSWPFIPYLYERGALASPWDVYDVYRVRAGQARGSVCRYDWFVDAPGGSSWSSGIRRQAKRCGTFHEVFSRPEPLVGLTNDRLDFIQYTGYARIWKNVRRERSGSARRAGTRPNRMWRFRLAGLWWWRASSVPAVAGRAPELRGALAGGAVRARQHRPRREPAPLGHQQLAAHQPARAARRPGLGAAGGGGDPHLARGTGAGGHHRPLSARPGLAATPDPPDHQRRRPLPRHEGPGDRPQRGIRGRHRALPQPPERGDPEREGDAKAGNLNSAVRYIDRNWQDICFIEVRDADDEVVDPAFLRACIAQLQHDEATAYVQTVKEARVSRGDPFDNGPAAFLPRLHARPPRRQRRVPVRVRPRLAARGAGRYRRLSQLEPRRGPSVGHRGAPAGLARRLFPGTRCHGPARTGGHPGHLQAARHVGPGHDAAGLLGRAAGTPPAPAAAVP